MINVSDRFYQQMQARTDFEPKAVITLASGTVLNIGPEDCTIGGNTVIDGAAANSVPLGAAVCKMMTLSLMNEDDRFSDYDFYRAKITLSARFRVESGSSSSYETIYIGTFWVVTPETKGATVTMSGADAMYRADRPYSTGIPFPATLRQIVNDACLQLGYTAPGNFPNENFIVKHAPENASYRQVIGGAAGIAGGNAFIDRYGQLAIKRYDLSPIATVMNGLDSITRQPACHVLRLFVHNPTVDTDDITITGIRAELDDGSSVLSGTAGYVLTVDNPLISEVEDDAVYLMGDALIGLTFRQFIGSYIGYPIADFMDPAIVIDRKGNAYGTFLTDITYTFCGGTEFKNSAEPVIRNENSAYSLGTRTLQKAREQAGRRLSAYEAQMESFSELMSLGLGLYIYKTENEDGSTVYVLGNHDTLEGSDIQWKMTAQGLGVSTDYGETWTSGWQANGTLIVRVLTAQGINADWINAGTLTLNDGTRVTFSGSVDTGAVYIDARKENGSKMFFLDSANGVLEMYPDAFTLSNGDSIEDIAAEAIRPYIESVDEQLDSMVMQYFIQGRPTTTRSDAMYQLSPNSEWTDSASHVGDLCYDLTTGKTYKWAYAFYGTRLTFSDDSATYNSFDYLKIFYKIDDDYYMLGSWSGSELAGLTVLVPHYDIYLYWHTNASGSDAYGFLVTATREYVDSTPAAGTALCAYSDKNLITKNNNYVPGWSATDKAYRVATLESEHSPYSPGLDEFWRWQPLTSGGQYSYMWLEVQDEDITNAMAAAAKAQDTADGKRRNFITQPTPPYDRGDIWMDGELIRACRTSRKAGESFNAADWGIFNSYSDPDAVFDYLTAGGTRQGLFQDPVTKDFYMNLSYLKSGILKITNPSTNKDTLVVDGNTGEVKIYPTTFAMANGDTIESIAQAAAHAYTQEELFNILTNNGQTQGLWFHDNKIYINWEYAKGGALTLGGASNSKGYLTVVNSSGYEVLKVDNSGLTLEDANGLIFSTTAKGYIDGLVFGAKNSSGVILSKISILEEPAYNTFRLKIYNRDEIRHVSKAHSFCIGSSSGDTGVEKMRIDANGTAFWGGVTLRGGTKIYDLDNISSSSVIAYKSDGYTLGWVSTSSKRIKDIRRPLKSDDINKAYDICVYLAKYKDGYLAKDDQRCGVYYPMFVAEQMQECIPDAVDLDNEGKAANWNHRVLIPVMFQMIKDQKSTIDKQEEKIKSLEERLSCLEAMMTEKN